MAKLRVFLQEPQGNARLRVGDVCTFRISVTASAVPEGVAEIRFDEAFFVLVDSVKQIVLPAGSYQKDVTWYVKPLVPIKETTISALVAAGIAQATNAVITIIP